MTDASNQPEWLERWRAQAPDGPALPAPAPTTAIDPTRQGPDGRWLKGVSGNAAGRKPGIVDKRTRITQALAEDAQRIVDVIVGKALEGDLGACGLVLARIAPPLKAEASRVEFELSRDAPLSEQAEQIVLAVAQGRVDPETAKMLINCLHAVGDLKAIENLESRVLSLEAKQIG
jgi:hypothetical protein